MSYKPQVLRILKRHLRKVSDQYFSLSFNRFTTVLDFTAEYKLSMDPGYDGFNTSFVGEELRLVMDRFNYGVKKDTAKLDMPHFPTGLTYHRFEIEERYVEDEKSVYIGLVEFFADPGNYYAKASITMPTERLAIAGKKEEYQAFFQKKLKKWKVKSPSDLSTSDKKTFFAEIEREWDGEKT